MVDYSAAATFVEDLRDYCNRLLDVAQIRVTATKEEKAFLVKLLLENSTLREEELAIFASAENQQGPGSEVADFDAAKKFLEDLRAYFNEVAEGALRQVKEMKQEKEELLKLLDALQKEAVGIPVLLSASKLSRVKKSQDRRSASTAMGFWEEDPFEEYVSPLRGQLDPERAQELFAGLPQAIAAYQAQKPRRTNGYASVDPGWDINWDQNRLGTFATEDSPEILYEPQGISAPNAEAIKNRYIIGKLAGKHLVDHRGNIIIEKGTVITSDTIRIAEEEGKLVELILNMTWKKE